MGDVWGKQLVHDFLWLVNVFLFFMVEQVWTRALYPRIAKDCDVGCNTSLYTHTCSFIDSSLSCILRNWGFEKMCSQWWAVSSARGVFLMVINLELNIKTLKGLWMRVCVLGWGLEMGGRHSNSILCRRMRSFQCEMHFIFWMKMAQQIKYLQNETYKR